MKSILCIFAVFLWLSLTGRAVTGETITIASNENASPGWSAYSEHHGYILHIAAEAFALVGIRVEMDWYSSWKRAFEQAKNNEADSTCCWFFVADREEDFYYSDPVTEETQVFFHLKSFKFDWETVDDLEGLRIGGNTGFHYGDVLDEAERAGRISMDRARSYEQNLKKLLAGRIQIYPAAAITAYDHLESTYSPGTRALFTYHRKPLLRKQLHLLLPKKMNKDRARRVLTQFNEGLRRIGENGTYDRIMKNAEAGVYRKKGEKWRLR